MQLNLLYAVIHKSDTKILASIKEEFFDDDHKEILRFVRLHHAKYGKFPDAETVEQEFEIEFERTSDPAQFWYDKLLVKYRERLVEEAVKEAVRKKTIEPFAEAIQKWHKADGNGEVINYGDNTDERLQVYTDRLGTSGIAYLSTGVPELDDLTFGIGKTDYWLIGGQEGVGKTWWLLRLAYGMSNSVRRLKETRGRPIFFINNEMDVTELIERVDAMQARISYTRLTTGKLNVQEQETLRDYLSTVKARKNSGKEIFRVVNDINRVSEIEQLINLYNPAMIIVDGIHLVSKSFDWQDMMTANRDLKALTRRYNVPIISAAHLKAKAGVKEDEVNTDSFAYFKGARDADVSFVFFQDDQMANDDEIGLKMVKGRKGQKGAILYRNHRETTEQTIIRVV